MEDFGVMFRKDTERPLDYYIGIRAEDAKGDRTDTICLDVEGGLDAG